MGATREIAEWVSALRFEDLPPRIVEEAKTQILSVLGAVYASLEADVTGPLLRTIASRPAAPEATLLATGERVSAESAVYANAALSMALDYDDYLFAGHTGHSAVLVPLALAERLGVSGRDLLVAQVAANEVEGRIGASVLLGPLNGQLWSFIHLAGGALAAGKLLALDVERMTSALGVAMLQPNYGLAAGFFASEAKALLASTTAVAGMQAAELAANGLRGGGDVLESAQGFVRAFSRQPLFGAYRGLGSTWVTDTLCVKIYPGCAYLDTLVDAILDAVGAAPLDPDDVTAIEIAATPLTVGMDRMAAPHLRGPESSATTLNFSVAYNAAVALIDRELGPKQFRPSRTRDPRVWALAERVHLGLDPEFTELLQRSSPLRAGRDGFELDLSCDLSGFRMSFGARVDIRLAGGRVEARAVEVPRGAAGTPPGDRRAHAVAKFRREASPVIGAAAVEAAIDGVGRLEELSASELAGFVGGLGAAKRRPPNRSGPMHGGREEGTWTRA